MTLVNACARLGELRLSFCNRYLATGKNLRLYLSFTWPIVEVQVISSGFFWHACCLALSVAGAFRKVSGCFAALGRRPRFSETIVASDATSFGGSKLFEE